MSTYTSIYPANSRSLRVFTTPTQLLPQVTLRHPDSMRGKLAASGKRAFQATERAFQATGRAVGSVAHSFNVFGGEVLEGSIALAKRSYNVLRRPSNALSLAIGSVAIGVATRNFDDIMTGAAQALEASSQQFAGLEPAAPSATQENLTENALTTTGLVLGGLGAFLFTNVRGTIADAARADFFDGRDVGLAILRPQPADAPPAA